MTAVMDRPAVAPDRAAWRDRLHPPVATASRRNGWLAALVVGAIAGVLRFVRLDLPAGRIFDEVYYACDAQNLLRFGVEVKTLTDPDDPSVAEQCEPDGVQPGFVVHPPLGKWAIALGMRLFGVNELGWRFAAAVFGTLTVIVLVRLARRMTGSTVLGALAGVLLALDGLHFVQSRIAMLDVFLVFWTTAAAACLVADRDWVRQRLALADDSALRGRGPRLGFRPWLALGGVCLGAAIATKWSGVYYLAALAVLVVAWETGARRAAGTVAPFRAVLARSTALLATALVVVPAAVYTLSWAGWFASDVGWSRNWAASQPATGVAALVPDGVRSWVHYHQEILEFHANLDDSHPYQSHPAQWLVLARPVSYYYPPDISVGDYGCTADSCAREVLAIGTPALWWAGLAALVVLIWHWVARRDWRAGAVVVLVAVGIVPWIRDDLAGRTMFLFYALPAVPFLALGVALVAGYVVGSRAATRRRRALGLGLVGAYVSLVVVNFAWLYPLLAAQTLPYEQWRERIWFTSWI